MRNWLQKKCINLLVHHLFNTVTSEDILRTTKRGIMYGKRTLTPEEVQRLHADAGMWKDSFLWEVLRTECQHQANLRMFKKSQTPDDMLMGKAMLYLLEVIEVKLSVLHRS